MKFISYYRSGLLRPNFNPGALLLVFMLLFLGNATTSFGESTLVKWTATKGEPIYYYIHKENKKEIHLKFFRGDRVERVEYTYMEASCMMKYFVGTYNYNLKKKEYVVKFGEQVFFFYPRVNSLAISKHEDSRTPYYSINREYDDWQRPFYFKPNEKALVNNLTTPEHLDAADLIYWLTYDKKNQAEKLRSIEEFIAASMEYDYEELITRNGISDRLTYLQILGGDRRMGVCRNYSQVLADLCADAKIECKIVKGIAKNSVFGGASAHSWNIVMVDGHKQLHDITWADQGKHLNWLNANPSQFITSHLPANVEDQIVSEVISRKEFDKLAYIEPSKKNVNQEYFYSPKNLMNFVKDSFEFKIDTALYPFIVTDAVLSSDWYVRYHSEPEMDNSYIELPYENYKMKIVKKRSYYEVKVKLNNLQNIISVRSKQGFKIVYKVFNGPERDYIKKLAFVYDAKYINSYLAAVVASIKIRDSNQFEKLTGHPIDFFIEKNQRELIQQKISTWDYSLGQWQSHLFEYTANKNDPSDKDKKELVNYIVVNDCEFYFHKTPDNRYLVDRIIVDPSSKPFLK